MSLQLVPGVGLIIIGSEILDGRIQDTHFAACGALLRAHRLPLAYSLVLPDDPGVITAQLRWALAQDVPFFCSGGIGGTPDDHTRHCAAAAAGVQVTTHPEGHALLRQRFGQDEIPDPILRMVQFPRDAVLIPNPVNQIPGFSIGNGHFVPGFPQMARPMMEWVISHYYERGQERKRRTILLPGAREAHLTETLEILTAGFPELAISSLPRFTSDGTEVELSVSGSPQPVDAATVQLLGHLEALGMACTEQDPEWG